MKTRKLNKAVLAGIITLLTGSAALQATVLVSYDAALAGAGNTPEDVVPAWQYFSNGPDMVNNGTYLEQNYSSSQYGYFNTTALPAGTINVGIADYGISTTMRPLSNIPFGGGSDYANILLEWQDTSSYYGTTFWLAGGAITFGPGGGSIITGIDWSSAHTLFIGYNHVADSFSFYLDGTLKNTLTRSTLVLGSNFLGANQVAFGDATTGGGISSQADWSNISIYDTAVIPEPSTFALCGLVGVLAIVRRASRRRA